MTQLQADLEAAQAAVTRQGDAVRALKAELKTGGAKKEDVDAAILKLKDLKVDAEAKAKAYEAVAGTTSSTSKEAFRANLANALERKLFYIPSFQIYGSVAGFYDFGPPGCAVKQNITQFWRQHFVLAERMLEVECPAVTPEVVLKASGHVERFTDFMVTDVQSGDCHRADHLLEAALEAILEDTKNPPSPEKREEVREALATVEELGPEDLGAALRKYGVRAPDTANELSAPFPFNLMFRTSIGPKGDAVGYLRPETAQGIFVDFKQLLYYNGGKLPFAAAQIGQSYRNEIAPRAGLLRVREFTQAEIEHFCHPDHKEHPKFARVAGLAPLLFSRELQLGAEKVAKPVALGEAVAQKIIANETLAYFIGRTAIFMAAVGIDPARLRFRQHLVHEMAHYAEDCWDAEVHCSYGWIECAGLADRSAYDLRVRALDQHLVQAHAAKSKQDLTAYERFDPPQLVEVTTAIPNKPAVGKAFKKDAKAVQEALETMGAEDASCLRSELEAHGKAKVIVSGQDYEVDASMVEVKTAQKKLNGRNFVPSVIEPSFGIGRIMYCALEHVFYAREGDEKRTVLRFPPLVAPYKTTIFPLIKSDDLLPAVERVSTSLEAAAISSIEDTTGTSIGRRYARTDELGIPFGITIDKQTLEDDTVTLRERDSTSQVRILVEEVAKVVRQLVDSQLQWTQVQATYPAQQPPADD